MPRQRGAAPARRAPIKRTKTYTGCWTCRDRGVKCDLGKPHCVRCMRSKRVCDGYGIRLLWVEQQQNDAPHPQRRLFADPARHNPIFDEDHINAALEDIDSPDHACDIQIAPFTVFRLSCAPQNERPADEDQSLKHSTPSSHRSHYSHTAAYEGLRASCNGSSSPLSHVKVQVLSLLQPFLASATIEERKLFRHWVSYLSGVFLPTPRSDNPFRTIFIPLALASAEADKPRPGHAALLHCIYATSAFHLAQRQDCPEYAAVAVKHQEIGLRYLRQSIAESGEGQHEATLAAIIMMTSMEVITGIPLTWRIHVRGGREWLQAQKPEWKETYNARILYQIFEFIELVGHMQCGQKAEDGSDEPLEQHCPPSMTKHDCSAKLGSYHLDRFFGIPKPLFDALDHMNHLRHESCRLSESDLEAIEVRILAAKPDTTPLREPSSVTERLATHQALVFYYACRIHLERDFRQVPPSQVQELVGKCLDHLEEVQAIEQTVDACGLLWPEFITACEAEDTDLRVRMLRVFDKGEKLGIGSITQAAKVVQEVWRRRDESGEYTANVRRELMELQGFDLLLT